MPTYATPGVYFEKSDSADQSIATLRTDVAAFVGIAQRGPLNEPVPVNSWIQFQSVFGDFVPNAYLAYSAKAFFENGGQTFHGVRVAAPASGTATVPNPPGPAQPADGLSSTVLSTQGFVPGAVVTIQQTITAKTTGLQPADRLSSLVDSVDGFLEGSIVCITQGTVKSWRRLQSVDGSSKTLFWKEPLDPAFNLALTILFQIFRREARLLKEVNAATGTLTWESPLRPAFNVDQLIQFETGAAVADGGLFDAAGNPTLAIESSSPGAWGNDLSIAVSRSNLASTMTGPQPQPIAGTASYVQSATGFPRYSLVKVFQSGSPPVVEHRIVTAIDFTTNALTWNLPLTPAFDITRPISFETVEFGLTVYWKGIAREVFTGLSLQPNHARYVERMINPPATSSFSEIPPGTGSEFIRVKDLKVFDPAPANLPDPVALQLDRGRLTLSGGRDGIAALKAIDFTGDPSSDIKRGLRTLEDVDEVSTVAIPDVLIEPRPAAVYAPVPPKPGDPCLPCSQSVASVAALVLHFVEATPHFTLEEIFRVQQALIAHCESLQFRFAILDPPDFGYPNERIDLAEVQTWRNRFDSAFAALYFPWIFVSDPLRLENETVRRVPPSGHIAGVYAHTDLTVGVFKAPANVPLLWAQAPTTDVSANAQGFLNPISVNCVRTFSGRGIRIYGARTLGSYASWRFVNVRRLVSMIEHALVISLQWAVFEPNDVHLWNVVKLSVTGFLEVLWEKGALKGNSADEAFFVKCDLSNNPLAATEAGQLHVEIGIAPVLPAEFVVFRLGRTEDTWEVSEMEGPVVP